MISTSTETARLISYLSLPPAYGERLGGVQWSYLSPHLAHPSGEIAMPFDAMADFIEGFSSQRDLIPFPSLLHWAMICNPCLEFGLHKHEHFLLRDHFSACGQPWRNAGALIGWLSRDLPSAVDPPSANHICNRLRDEHQPVSLLAGMLNGLTSTASEPALGFDALFAFASKALKPLSSDEIDHWLRFGRGALSDAGRKLAEEKPTPAGVGRIIDELLERPRLAGAAPYLSQMIAALSVPTPRRREHSLPVGGYSDVVTRGTPDRMLPSQHALDEIDFLRRYSENELLYFQRDDPPSHPKRDLAIVMDQGIRTWGDVRLVLTAATLALAKNAANANRRCSVFFTSRPQHFENALAGSDREFAEALEASDLTHDPGATLEYVLQQEIPTPRDVFLLTHPRNLDEEDVGIAARRLTGDNRLFALAVNGRGDAEVAEFRRGRPLRLRTFRVEFVSSEPPTQKSETQTHGWTGDVEKIGWPFLLGLDDSPRSFDFDHLSERIFILSGASMLHVWTLADGQGEMLPRPKIAAEWKELIGLRGGFALIGSHRDRVAVAHYDLLRRSCKTYSSERVWSDRLRPRYSPAQHLLALVRAQNSAVVLLVDLQTETIAEVMQTSPSATEVDAVGNLAQNVPHLIRVPMRSDLPFVSATPMYCYEESTGKFHVLYQDRRLLDLEHRSNDQTLPQREFRFEKAELNGDVFSLVGTSYGLRELHSFDLSSGHYVTSQTIGRVNDSAYRISTQGHWIATISANHLNVTPLGMQSRKSIHAGPKKHSRHFRLWASERAFLVVCGSRSQVAYFVDWSGSQLHVVTEISPTAIRDLESAQFRHPRLVEFVRNEDPTLAAESRKAALFSDDERRWKGYVQRGSAHFLVDCHSQIAVIDGGRRIVFMMLFFGDSWSAWMPPDVRYGVGSMHPWLNSKGALEKMGRAVAHACDGEWR